METDLSCDRADVDPTALADAAHAGHSLLPADMNLLELARWGSLLVNAAIMAHQQPGALGTQVRLVNVALVLQRMLAWVQVSGEGGTGGGPRRRRGKRSVGRA